jgi:hypothetical protein
MRYALAAHKLTGGDENEDRYAARPTRRAPRARGVSAPPGSLSAAEVTVAQTLALLDGPHAPVARDVANGRYVFWLGSGISRGRVHGLDGVVQRVLEFLQTTGLPEGAESPHLRALVDAVELADLRPEERARTDLSKPVDSWPDLAVLVSSLEGKYAKLLDIRVEGKPADYLLWDAVDVCATYPRGATPDCEHLAIAVLVLEGVLTEAPTANWDGLIESALKELAASAAHVQVVVLEQDLREPAGILRLIKFHGCAILAADDPGTYRNVLIARASQISDWPFANETAAIRGELVSLATTRPTLMIGLSAQDANIKAVFSEARARMRWRWLTDPSAHVFAGDRLGHDHIEILKMVYRDDYEGNEAAIEAAALIRAYGAPLLTALVLHVAVAKLRAFLSTCDAPGLDEADRSALGDGIRLLRDAVAARAEPDRLAFLRALITNQTRVLGLFRSGVAPATGTAPYQPIGSQPLDRIPIEPWLETSGMRELAAGLGLLGREAGGAAWALDLAETGDGHHGALRVVAAGRESAVFFVANPRAGVALEASGAAPIESDDVVVLHSTGPVPRLPRSPHGRFGRTGRARARQVDMSKLLREAKDLPDLEQRFRQEAGL